MKIALVCEHGGHLTEMFSIMESIYDHDYFFITNQSPRTKNLKFKHYLIEPIGTSPIIMLKALLLFFKIFKKENPSVIITTGAEIAIPAFSIGKIFFNTKNIFIESWTRVNTPSITGRILYPISDIFLVQWPELIEKYGKKAQYQGAVI